MANFKLLSKNNLGVQYQISMTELFVYMLITSKISGETAPYINIPVRIVSNEIKVITSNHMKKGKNNKVLFSFSGCPLM